MKKVFLFYLLMSTIYSANAQTPPKAAKKPHAITTHGDTREDPYYWMNQYWVKGPDSTEVVNYLTAENDYFKAKMQPVASLQDKLYTEILGRIKQTDESVPYFKNGYWYMTRFKEGGEYPIYVRKKGTMNAPDEVMLDVNEMAKAYKYYQVSGLSVSPDNKLLTYGVDTLSRRKYTLFFKNLETGETLSKNILNTEGYGVWANDNNTLFFTTKDEVTLRSDKVMRYDLKNDKSDLVYHEKDETYGVGVGKSKSEQYISIVSNSTLSSETRFIDASKPQSDFQVFLPRQKDHLYYIEDYKGEWYITTNWNAKNFRLMKAPIASKNQKDWVEVIPHRTDVMLTSTEIFRDYLVINERKNAATMLRIIPWDKSKKEHYIDFGESAYTAYSAYNPEYNTDLLRYGYTSMTTPSSTYEYNMTTHDKKLLKQQEVLGGYNPADYVTERLWATAKDGTKIPMSIVYKKGFKKDGKQPLLLYGYGSYGNNIDPYFSSANLSLLNRGFAYCIAHIRGGEEMGRGWYEDGKMFKKQNTFTDFIDCAEYLIKNGYTTKEHLYANGGSAGGLLMGAVVNMRPDLWRGIVAAVPFVDVVTTMLDESIPLTTGEFDEWGNPKNKESYFYMKSYSPYDNIKPVAYPNMLVTTGLHDSQVQYFEPAKWVARLREMKTDNNLLLLETNMDVGHGGASGRFQRIKETARNFAFILMLEGITE